MAEQRITIQGQDYVVIERETVEDYEARGLENLVQFMNETGRVAQLQVRKPKGRVMFFVAEFAPSNVYESYSRPIRIGR